MSTPAGAGSVLLPIARAAIAAELGVRLAANPGAAWLSEPGACFVTLTQQGRLRGCIGSLEAWEPLLDDVRHNAVAAAFRDPRFPRLRRDELDRTTIEVSVLSPSEPLRCTSESDAMAQLRPHRDGVILRYGGHRATFLPQVWEQLPDMVDFMAALKRKAGLRVDFWHHGIELSRYSVTSWTEGEESS